MSGESGENGEVGNNNSEGDHEQADFIRLLLAEQENDEAEDEVFVYSVLNVLLFISKNLVLLMTSLATATG